MKVKVRLKAAIDQPGHGFLDPAGQKIRANYPKPGEKFERGQIFEVEKTDFVIERIKTGELIVVDERAETAGKLSEKERKAAFKEASGKLEQIKTMVKKEKLSPELQPQADELIALIEKAIHEDAVELLIEAAEKFQALEEALRSK